MNPELISLSMQVPTTQLKTLNARPNTQTPEFKPSTSDRRNYGDAVSKCEFREREGEREGKREREKRT